MLVQFNSSRVTKVLRNCSYSTPLGFSTISVGQIHSGTAPCHGEIMSLCLWFFLELLIL